MFSVLTQPMSHGAARSTQRRLLVAALALAGSLAGATALAESAVVLPKPAVEPPAAGDSIETAVFAGGCFWGMQAVFEHVKGVRQVLEGYSGGTKAGPSYEEVSSGDTGHAESVQIRFDPREVSYGQLLQVFFSVGHNPTELNRQGPDSGTQYRSAIFYANKDQERVAREYVAQLGKAGAFPEPIVTQLAPMMAFFPAEDYHQDYYLKHPDSAYIVINDMPKVENLKQLFPELYRETPVTVAEAGG